TAPAIATSVGLSRRDCQEWVYRFNESGLLGLDDQHGGGRAAPLTDEQEELVRKRINAGPTEEHHLAATAAVQSRTEPDGKLVALP
ncbi:MAG: hypothetical protein ABFC77_07500, partial [Thermoguttaceae bacterium]